MPSNGLRTMRTELRERDNKECDRRMLSQERIKCSEDYSFYPIFFLLLCNTKYACWRFRSRNGGFRATVDINIYLYLTGTWYLFWTRVCVANTLVFFFLFLFALYEIIVLLTVCVVFVICSKSSSNNSSSIHSKSANPFVCQHIKYAFPIYLVISLWFRHHNRRRCCFCSSISVLSLCAVEGKKKVVSSTNCRQIFTALFDMKIDGNGNCHFANVFNGGLFKQLIPIHMEWNHGLIHVSLAELFLTLAVLHIRFSNHAPQGSFCELH